MGRIHCIFHFNDGEFMLNKKNDFSRCYFGLNSGCSLSVSAAYPLVLTVVRSLKLKIFVSVILFMLNSLTGATSNGCCRIYHISTFSPSRLLQNSTRRGWVWHWITSCCWHAKLCRGIKNHSFLRHNACFTSDKIKKSNLYNDFF